MQTTYNGKILEELEYGEFCEFLSQFGSEKKADFDRKIIKTRLKLFGIKTSDIKEIVKYFKDKSTKKLSSFPKNEYYEITLIQGAVIAANKNLYPEEKFRALKEWIPYIDNWAHCDLVMSKTYFGKIPKDSLFPFAQDLIKGKTEFEIRCGVVLLLGCFLTEEYITRVFFELSKLRYGEFYYVDMAVAWLVATALINFKNETLNFLNNCEKLNYFTYAKSLQKARESYRISEADKAEYKKLIELKKIESK